MALHHQHLHFSYGQCNSFFIEAADGLYAQREEQRQQVQAAARQTQLALAEELSNVTADEYQDDILDDMEDKEVHSLDRIDEVFLY